MTGLPAVVRIARPRQWAKNVVCFAALVFSGRLLDPQAQRASLLIFVCFCLAASAIYIVNDLRDREADRAHPTKRRRPLASGELGAGTAVAEALVLAAAAGLGASMLPGRARVVLAVYVISSVLYSLALKQVAVVDVMTVALGFVLRVQAGIEATRAPQSAWVVLCMFFMALFLACGKRRGEIARLAGDATRAHRTSLRAYSIRFLDMLLGVSATTALVCYSLYAVTVQTDETFVLTILPVVYGIARYAMLVLIETEGEDPSDLLTRDVPIMATGVVWAGLCVGILYAHLSLFPGSR